MFWGCASLVPDTQGAPGTLAASYEIATAAALARASAGGACKSVSAVRGEETPRHEQSDNTASATTTIRHQVGQEAA